MNFSAFVINRAYITRIRPCDFTTKYNKKKKLHAVAIASTAPLSVYKIIVLENQINECEKWQQCMSIMDLLSRCLVAGFRIIRNQNCGEYKILKTFTILRLAVILLQ